MADSFRLNMAAFYYDCQDFQDSVSRLPTDGGPLEVVYLNLPEAESMGVEIETSWAVSDSLEVLFNYSWLKAEVKDACCFVDSADLAALSAAAKPGSGAVRDALGNLLFEPVSGSPQRAQDLTGNKLPNSPEHKAAVNLRYTLGFRPGDLTFSLSDTWRSETHYSIFNRPESMAEDYNQVDFRLLWNDALNRYTVIGSVQNIADEDGFDGTTSDLVNGVVYQSGSLTPPRTYNPELQYRFGLR
ncbi:TonB-dependent receptor [Proteobacteria bacterium 005FR1]|nr:TonB-dependent receptor [Proteobacteria bacterium 005FR1]